jgi:hypothetical protein
VLYGDEVLWIPIEPKLFRASPAPMRRDKYPHPQGRKLIQIDPSEELWDFSDEDPRVQYPRFLKQIRRLDLPIHIPYFSRPRDLFPEEPLDRATSGDYFLINETIGR